MSVFDLADPAMLRSFVQWIWVGRNDIKSANFSNAVLSVVEKMVGYLEHDRYLIGSVLNGAGEGRDMPYYSAIVDVNEKLSGRFGKHFVDIRRALILSASSPADDDDVRADIVPQSLRQDAVHLNKDGQMIVAKQMVERTIALGW